MEHGTVVFLANLTIALVAASVLGAAARALGMTPILGYLVAGVIIGPFAPGSHSSGGSLGGLSELGLILLLFSLGLGFSPGALRKIGILAVVGNFVLMALFGAGAWSLGVAFHLVHPVTLALAFSLSSTAIGVALLQIFGLLDTTPGRSAIALLVMQDLVAIALLIIVTAPAGALTPIGLLLPLLKAIFFVAFALLMGATLLHQIMARFMRRAPSEALVAFATAIALVAAWLGYLAGLSFEFGAFVAGAVISEVAGSRMVQSIVAPFRELFITLFFVSIGTLVNFNLLIAHLPLILGVGGVLIAIRFAGWFGLSRVVGQMPGTALAISIALIPLGEFNVVLANSSYRAGRLNLTELGTIIGAMMLSIVIAAIGTRVLVSRRAALDRPRPESVVAFREETAVLILGYGRVGRTTGAICKRAGVPFAVVELDVDRMRLAQRDGAEARYGDGADPSVVESALTPSTKVVLSTLPDTDANLALGRRLSHAAGLCVIARASRLRDIAKLRQAGVATALVPEAEGAFGFAEAVLAQIGVGEHEVLRFVAEQRAHIVR